MATDTIEKNRHVCPKCSMYPPGIDRILCEGNIPEAWPGGENKNDIPIESLKRLRIRPGDLVILKVPFALSIDHYKRLKNLFEDCIKEGFPDVKCIILEEGMDIDVLTKED